jgi:hypothetical protein
VHRRVDVLPHVEEEAAVRAHAIRPVLCRGEEGHEHGDRGERSAQGGAGRPLGPEAGPQDGQAGEEGGEREEPREAGDEAQPVGEGAPEEAQGNDERRVPPEAQEPLQAEPGAKDGQPGEGREAERGEERVAAVGQ